MACQTLSGLLDGRPRLAERNGRVLLTQLPYDDLGRATEGQAANQRDDVVFITARFRSGSTLLWNLFRNVPGCTAYYEPFNERRWFDPDARGNRIDRTHKQVEEYWREYDGLDELGRYYREAWIDKNLLMEADFWAPEMKRYIELLIERAPGRPVLQFNRVDFRLPWLRRHFPNAKFIHLYRHPRDEWCSTLMGIRCFPKDASPAEFKKHDKFYLLRWAHDLKFHFPFLEQALERHPYEAFYYIWRLSYLYGTAYANHSICFERLVEEPDEELTKLLGFTKIDASCHDALRRVIERPRIGQWRDYADDAWFRNIEARCEAVLQEFLNREAVCAQR
ncbi:MAG TPA: sulfotransferase [Pirellulales bacterium]|nr:sulfotransferase [Pirellulales bacterium]